MRRASLHRPRALALAIAIAVSLTPGGASAERGAASAERSVAFTPSAGSLFLGGAGGSFERAEPGAEPGAAPSRTILRGATPNREVDREEDPRAATAALCEAAIRDAARRHDVPARLLLAVALTESGRRIGDRRRPWPWTMNGAGAGHWLPTRAEGLRLAETFAAQGVASYDVGCMQVNRRWHGENFDSLEAMFDPARNVDYAARFLKALAAETGDWIRAAGLYHSRTPELARRYRTKVADAYARLGTDPDLATAALPPPPRRSSRDPADAARAEPERAAPREDDVTLARRAHTRFGLVGASGPLLRAAASGGLFGGREARPFFADAARPLIDPDAAPARGGLLEARPVPPARPEDTNPADTNPADADPAAPHANTLPETL
ncbi:MAG: lytic transglycosylase domain-containing protein [Pseudomonadota bacterium]